MDYFTDVLATFLDLASGWQASDKGKSGHWPSRWQCICISGKGKWWWSWGHGRRNKSCACYTIYLIHRLDLSKGSYILNFADPVQLTFLRAASVQFRSTRAPPSACSSPAPQRISAFRAPPRVGLVQLAFVSAGPAQFTFISAGPVQLTFSSAGPYWVFPGRRAAKKDFGGGGHIPDPPWPSESPDSPWPPEAPDPPWPPEAPDPPWSPEAPDPPWPPEAPDSPWPPEAPDPPWPPKLRALEATCPGYRSPEASRAPTLPPLSMLYGAGRA